MKKINLNNIFPLHTNKEYKQLDKQYEELDEQYGELFDDHKDLCDNYINLKTKYDNMAVDIYPNVNLQELWEHTQQEETTRKMWKAQRDGVYKYRLLSTYAKMTDKELRNYHSYLENFGLIRDDFTKTVWAISNHVDNELARKYKKESVENWASPETMFQMLLKGRIVDDCDGFALLKWYLISAATSYPFEDEKWRVRLAIVTYKGIVKTERHMNLVFAKYIENGLAEWVFIETTMRQNENKRFWNNPARYQNSYDIEYTFTDEKMYEGL